MEAGFLFLGSGGQMKRFLLFGYDTYYPSGGMRDFKESYDTDEEANAAGRTKRTV